MTIEIIKHKSGMEIILDKNDSPLIGINFRVKVGSINENTEQRGISHFIEHMAFTGTSKLSKEQIVKDTEQSGAYVNAYTSYDNTTYTIKCMTSNFTKCLSTLSDMLIDTQFYTDEFQKEKGVILQEISDRENNPNIVNYDELFKSLYKDDSMCTAIIGTKVNVNNFTKEDLNSFYKEYYIPQNMILSVSGNISLDDIISVIDEYFPKEVDGTITTEKTFTINDNKNIVYNNNFSQDSITWSYDLTKSDDYKTNNIRNIVNIYLGDGFSSILFKTIRDELGLVYNIYSGIYSIGKNNNLLTINTTCDSDKINTLYEEVPKALKLLKNLNQEDLDNCKNMAKFNIANSFESKTKASSNNIYEYQYYGKIMSYDESISIIDEITLEECHEFIDYLLTINPVRFTSKSSKQKEA